MLELENALDNLIMICCFLYSNIPVILRNNRLLVSEVTRATENEVATRVSDLHLFTKTVHVATNLLEICGGNVDNRGEVQAGNLNILHVCIEELQIEIGDTRIFRVFHANTEFIRLVLRQIESESVIVGHGLNELEKVDHVDAEDKTLGAIEGLKAVGLELQIDEHRMRVINRHDFDAG